MRLTIKVSGDLSAFGIALSQNRSGCDHRFGHSRPTGQKNVKHHFTVSHFSVRWPMRKSGRQSRAISCISGHKIEFDISSHANGVAVERSRGKTDQLHCVYCAPCQTVWQSSDDSDTRKQAIGHEKSAENDRSLEPIDAC